MALRCLPRLDDRLAALADVREPAVAVELGEQRAAQPDLARPVGRLAVEDEAAGILAVAHFVEHEHACKQSFRVERPAHHAQIEGRRGGRSSSSSSSGSSE